MIAGLRGALPTSARAIASQLVERGVLKASSHRAPLQLAFPVNVVGRWFPALYPM